MTRLKNRLYRWLGIVSPTGQWPAPVSRATRRAGRLAAQGVARGIDSRQPLLDSSRLADAVACSGDPFDSAPCTPACGLCAHSDAQTLSRQPNEAQKGDESLCCARPLLPRSERCDLEPCRSGGVCWRCDYEESTHLCVQDTRKGDQGQC